MTDTNQFRVRWIDLNRKSKGAPDPKYPTGVDLDFTEGAAKSCFTELPYPAKGCGYFQIRCNICFMYVAITTAGRLDDPRSMKLACKRKM